MGKFYRVKEDTFMWLKGAILEHNEDTGSNGGYTAISDIWDTTEIGSEYISTEIIESDENSRYFEKVYPIGDLKKRVFGTKMQARAAAEAMFQGDK